MKILKYDSDTGIFTWLVSPAKNVKAGSIAGMLKNNGYVVIGIKGKTFLAHRLAIIYTYGDCIDDYEVDHINHVTHDNKISNLRIATPSQNQFNRNLQQNNTSGIKGVNWDKRKKGWVARCSINGRQHYIGIYPDIVIAQKAVVEFRKNAHGEFKNNG